MSTARTAEAKYLTKKDLQILNLCSDITEEISGLIPAGEERNNYIKKWGNVGSSRDSNIGFAGKISNDALTTRGKSGKTLQANRNLRWTPLVFANKNHFNYIEVQDFSISRGILNYKINGEYLNPREIYEMEEFAIILPEVFEKLKIIIDSLTTGQKKDFWDKNKLPIPLMESCSWVEAVEVFSILSISVASELYSVDKKKLYTSVIKVLLSQTIDKNLQVPSAKYPVFENIDLGCPICKLPLKDSLDAFRSIDRETTFQPTISNNKRSEGEDNATQLVHINPLIDSLVNHNPQNVRFGHRWCNVAMTDHTLEDVLKFFEHITATHS